MIKVSPAAALVVAVLAPFAVVAAQFTAVRATNFASHDEWLVLSLASRGLISFPYADRPLALLFSRPAEWILPHDVRGHLVLHVFYLGVTGAIVGWLALGRLGLSAPVALLASVFTATWAPLDRMRLDSVQVGTRYSGVTAATLVAIALFIEGYRRGRPLVAAAGGIVAVATVLTIEGAVPVLAGAPLLVLAAAPGTLRDSATRRRFLRWSAPWEILLVTSIVPVLLSLGRRRGGAYNYQSAIGFDPHPVHLAASLLKQFAFSLGPLVESPLAELARRPVALAVAVFATAFASLGRGALATDDRRLVARVAVLGAVLAVLGWIALVVSPLVRTPARAQLLSAPGIALMMAASVALVASWLPPRARPLVLAAAGAWVVAVGAGRVAALQDDWDETSYWPRQRGALVQMIAQAPSLSPNTLVLLVDDTHSWPVNFGFRHAIQYLYGADVVGVVWKGHEFLYGARYVEDGVRSEPWPVIQEAWRSPPTLHRFEEVVVVRLFTDGRLAILDAWPPELPPLSPGVAYAPRARIGPGPPGVASRILAPER